MNEEYKKATSVVNSLVSKTSVPSKVTVRENRDISLVSLPSVSCQKTGQSDHNNMLEDTSSLFSEKTLDGKRVK